MSQNPLSRESSRRGAAERQRRWRRREAAKRRVVEGLRRHLGRDPSPHEMRAEIERELRALGLGSGPDQGGGGRDAVMPEAPADASPDTVLPDGGDGEDDRNNVNDDGDDLSPSRAFRELRRLAERRPSLTDPAQAHGVHAGRGVALASVSFELRIAEQRDRIFSLL